MVSLLRTVLYLLVYRLYYGRISLSSLCVQCATTREAANTCTVLRVRTYTVRSTFEIHITGTPPN